MANSGKGRIIEYDHDNFEDLNSKLTSFIIGLGDELLELEFGAESGTALYKPYINKPLQCKCSMTNWDLTVRNEQAEFIAALTSDYVDRDFDPREHDNKEIECWGVSYTEGESIDWHCHGKPQGHSDYSFCYYTNVPEGSSSLLFKDVHWDMKGSNWKVVDDYYKDLQNGFPDYPIYHECIPKNGKLIIWDAEVMHAVPPNTPEGRAALIGNIYLKDK